MKRKVYRWITRYLQGIRSIPHEIEFDHFTLARLSGSIAELTTAVERGFREADELKADSRSKAGWYWLDEATGDAGKIRADLGDEPMVDDQYDAGLGPSVHRPYLGRCRLVNRPASLGWHWYPDSALLNRAVKDWLAEKGQVA